MAQADFTRIASNIAGMNALNALKDVNSRLSIHQLRLATGKRINEAADDPAGLTIATKLKYKSRGLGVAIDNIGDAKNLLGVAEGGLTKITDILLLIRDKAEQGANDTLGADERAAIKTQIDEFIKEINDIAAQTEWNTQVLLDGSAASLTFQTGYRDSDVTAIDLTSLDCTATTLLIDGTAALTDHVGFNAYLGSVDAAITTVSDALQLVGAHVSRLTFKEESLVISQVNTEAAYSRIMNADMAYEQLEATKMQILQQTATAMLAQANMAPQGVLALFR